MDGSIVFARWSQCTPPSNTCFLGPIWVHTPQAPRSVQPFSHSSRQKVLTMDGSFSPQNCPCTWGSGCPSNTCFRGPSPLSIPFTISISSAVFAQIMAESLYTWQWVAPFPLKIVPSHGGIWTSSNRWVLGPTSQTASWSVQPFLQGRWSWQTDRQTTILAL